MAGALSKVAGDKGERNPDPRAARDRAEKVAKLLAEAVSEIGEMTETERDIYDLATSGDPKSRTPPKLLWLDAEPASVKTLEKAMSDKLSAKLFASVEARLAWPGKPGAPAPPVIKPLTETQTALFEKGKTIYATLCAACHQPHGFGLDGLAPPLVDSEWVLGKTDVLARIVMHGLAGPVKVSGRTYNLAMPPLPQLTDEDIAGVLTYIRREWEHNGSAIETKAVAAIRDQNKGRMMMWTEEELKNLGKKK
jgi:mono/diheme cytochrome c family protein